MNTPIIDDLSTYGGFSAIVFVVIYGVTDITLFAWLALIAALCCVPMLIWLIWMYLKGVFTLLFTGGFKGVIKAIIILAVTIFPAYVLLLWHAYLALAAIVCGIIFLASAISRQ